MLERLEQNPDLVTTTRQFEVHEWWFEGDNPEEEIGNADVNLVQIRTVRPDGTFLAKDTGTVPSDFINACLGDIPPWPVELEGKSYGAFETVEAARDFIHRELNPVRDEDKNGKPLFNRRLDTCNPVDKNVLEEYRRGARKPLGPKETEILIANRYNIRPVFYFHKQKPITEDKTDSELVALYERVLGELRSDGLEPSEAAVWNSIEGEKDDLRELANGRIPRV